MDRAGSTSLGSLGEAGPTTMTTRGILGRGTRGNPWTRALWLYVPAALLLAGAALAVREFLVDNGGDRIVAIAADYASTRDNEIAFFEARVKETRDSLSYNRLTGLYLQRLRETGDVADLGRAERSATASLEVARGAYSGLINLGIVRVAQHRFEEAAALAVWARDLNPGDGAAYAVLGDSQMATGQYAEASLSYQKMLELAPGPGAFIRQAALAELRGNVEVALQFWDSAIAADAARTPENAAWARVQKGNLHFAQGQLRDAKEAFSQALAAFPGYPAAEAGLGRVASAEGDTSEAIRRFEQATATVPLPEYLTWLGEVLARDGQEAAAGRQFALVDVIGRLYAENGVTDDLPLILFAADHRAVTPELVARTAEAYKRRPGVDAASVYAWVLHRAGRSSEAAPIAEKSLALGTQDPALLYRAGTVLTAAGDVARGGELLRAAAALNASFSAWYGPDLQQALSRGTK